MGARGGQYAPAVDDQLPPGPAMRARFDAVRYLVPRIGAIDEQVAALQRYGGLDLRRQVAALNILHLLQNFAQDGVFWARAFNFPTVQVKAADQLEHMWLIFQAGDRLQQSLSAQDVAWPPPYRRPPPAITRDLLALYEVAADGYYGDGEVADRLQWAFDDLVQKSTQLIHGIKMSSDAAKNDALQAAADATRGKPPASTRSRMGALIVGAATVVTLGQGPGMINTVWDDLQELRGNITEISQIVASGYAKTLWDFANSLEVPDEVRLDYLRLYD